MYKMIYLKEKFLITYLIKLNKLLNLITLIILNSSYSTVTLSNQQFLILTISVSVTTVTK